MIERNPVLEGAWSEPTAEPSAETRIVCRTPVGPVPLLGRDGSAVRAGDMPRSEVRPVSGSGLASARLYVVTQYDRKGDVVTALGGPPERSSTTLPLVEVIGGPVSRARGQSGESDGSVAPASAPARTIQISTTLSWVVGVWAAAYATQWHAIAWDWVTWNFGTLDFERFIEIMWRKLP